MGVFGFVYGVRLAKHCGETSTYNNADRAPAVETCGAGDGGVDSGQAALRHPERST